MALPNGNNCDVKSEIIEFKRKNIPHQPGVYIFKDSEGNVIYVGKAKDLFHRVNSYFQSKCFEESDYGTKIRKLVEMAADLEFILMETEKEAFILENELIKKYQPRFNSDLKDDRFYPWIVISTDEKYPRINVIQSPRHFDPKKTYFGPYTNIGMMRKTLKMLRNLFPFCSCTKPIPERSAKRPCLNYQLKQCLGPCIQKITSETYRENIDSIIQILKGKTEDLLNLMKGKMDAESKALNFEAAAFWRDKIRELLSTSEKQSIFNYKLSEGMDFIGTSVSDEGIAFSILLMRGGRVSGNIPFFLDTSQSVEDQARFMVSFLMQFYITKGFEIPKTIYYEQPISEDDSKNIGLILSEKAGMEIELLKIDNSNENYPLMRIANKNADLILKHKLEYGAFLRESEQINNKIIDGLYELQELLHLPSLPRTIEGYDMANLQGTDAVGSMVCFIDGKPSKTHYRRFKVKATEGPNDVGQMREVLTRRLNRIIINGETHPDLILVDGGKPQLNMAFDLLKIMNLDFIAVIGLAKQEEEIFTTFQDESIKLPKSSGSLHVIQQVRDEAHRFATTYHKLLRSKRIIKSELDEIPGIGDARKKQLLNVFGSVDEIKAQSREELMKVVPEKIADKIIAYFSEQKKLSGDKQRKVKKTKFGSLKEEIEKLKTENQINPKE
mgnify:CR=1 FL=1